MIGCGYCKTYKKSYGSCTYENIFDDLVGLCYQSPEMPTNPNKFIIESNIITALYDDMILFYVNYETHSITAYFGHKIDKRKFLEHIKFIKKMIDNAVMSLTFHPLECLAVHGIEIRTS